MKKIIFPFLLIANICFGQVDLNLGLKAYYPFTGNANDVSGNNNNPVFNNATLTADHLGNPNSAYHFNGATSYIQVPNSATLNTTNKLSLSAWVRPTGFYGGPCHGNSVISKGNTATTPGLYAIWYDDNAGTNGANCGGPLNPAVENFYGIGGMAPPPGYTPYIQLNQWYSVIVTYDGTTVKLYIDCQLKYSAPQGSINFTNPQDLFIGKVNNPSFPYWVNGDIDEVRIYDRALTVDEVNVLGGCSTGLTCTNWLRTQTVGQSVTVGDLDVTGNQITIEANFNCSSFPLSRPDKQEDIVSKHANTTDINYVLRMDLAGITTTNGQFLTPFPCDNLVINKTYHVALVYNGSTLKFYRDGFLMSQIAATGNLITNNWQTTIGDYAVNNPQGTNFLGYINEVRIWNVARTQTQIQTYMDASLPNPTTQPGLLAYYTFDDLLNKQGNASWNGTLNNGATINNTNPNCSFVVDSCALASCDTWLKTSVYGDYATVGDLDITGNQITVEANFNRTAPLNSGLYPGHLVSKHTDVSNVNYALFPNGCAITTTTGYKSTFENCAIDLNKTYHVAMVYDGSFLKFYRNGFLHSQVACTGNMITNDLLTTIAEYAGGGDPDAQFKGNVNEVRIWNVARTQAQIQTYMDAPLPNPTTQTGLRGYYVFNNLLNKQGNAAYNATLNGGATINTTNSNCTFVADSCAALTPCDTWLTTTLPNSNAQIGDLDISGTQITVEANFNKTIPGGPVGGGFLLSKHTTVGDINYALWPNGCAVSTVNGDVLLQGNCEVQENKTYHVAMVYDGTTVKFYRNGFLQSQAPLSGNLVLNNLIATIGENSPGGGPIYPFTGNINEVRIWNVARTQAEIQTYMNASLPNPTTQTGLKGYYVFNNLLNKQGNTSYNATLNGGATINTTNSNCTFVADSCAVLAPCDTWLTTTLPTSNAQIGDLDISGSQITVEANFNKTIPGGPVGGGFLLSKHTTVGDINYALWPNGCAVSTVNGDVLLQVNCQVQQNKTYHVAMVYDGTSVKFYRDGSLLSQAPLSGNLVLNNLIATIGENSPGGGPIYPFTGNINEVRIWNVARTQAEIQTYMNASLPNPTTQTGLKGYYVFNNLLNKQGNPAYNATLNGGATINTTNLDCTFTQEILTVANAGNDTSFCSNGPVSKVLQGSGGGTYSWTPAIYLNNPNLQNPTATVSTTTTFYLTVSSGSACSAIDSVTIYVNPLPIVKTLTDTAICKGSVLVLTTTAGVGTYHWSPGIYVSDSTIASPVFIDIPPRTLYVTGTTALGCSAKDTINIMIKPSPVVKTIEDTLICSTNQVTLFTGGAQTYTWTPTIFLSNPNIASPVFSGNSSQTYYVTGTAVNGCTAKDTVSVNVNLPMVMQKPPDKSMCINGSVQLDGYNGNTVAYLWSPSTYLSSTTIINPIANPPATTFYTVKISDLACIHDSTFTVQLIVNAPPSITVSKSNDVDCAIRSANLLASGGDTYLWTPSTGLNNPNIPNPVATPTATQKYVVLVSNASGCSNMDSVTVYSNLKASLARYMPNAFTPNGDGLNDCYGLKNWMHIKKLEFMIFNRYGEQIFYTSDASRCWDGTYKGKKSDPGTYVYYIKAQTDCGTEEQKGNFLLIR